MSAYHDMIVHTSTADAPLIIIAADDKKSARIYAMQAVVAALSKALDLDYPPADPALIAMARAALG